MLGESLDESGNLVFGEVFLDEAEEVLFDLEAVLVLHFEKREFFHVVLFKVFDHGGSAVEELAGDGRGVDDFLHRSFALADVVSDHFGVFRDKKSFDRESSDALFVFRAFSDPVVDRVLRVRAGIIAEDFPGERADVNLFCRFIDALLAELDGDFGLAPELALRFELLDEVLDALVDRLVAGEKNRF